MLSETKADDVVDALRRLGQHAMAQRVGSWLEDPLTRHASTLACLHAITQAQEQENAGKRAQCFLQKAQLAPSASIETVWTGPARGLTKKVLADLKEGEWLRRGQNLVVTGPAGVGKTYLATALARHALVTHQAKVAHYRMPELLRKCSEAEATGGWTKLLAALARPDLVVLEHFALEPIAIDDTRRLVEWLDARERKERPTMVVAPTPPDEWDDYFAGDTARSLLLRRLLKEGTVIELAPIARKPTRSE